MQKYCVLTIENVEHHYIVAASNEQEAREKVLSGEYAPEDSYSFGQEVDDVEITTA